MLEKLKALELRYEDLKISWETQRFTVIPNGCGR